MTSAPAPGRTRASTPSAVSVPISVRGWGQAGFVEATTGEGEGEADGSPPTVGVGVGAGSPEGATGADGLGTPVVGAGDGTTEAVVDPTRSPSRPESEGAPQAAATAVTSSAPRTRLTTLSIRSVAAVAPNR